MDRRWRPIAYLAVLLCAAIRSATAANGIAVLDLAGNSQDEAGRIAVGANGRIYVTAAVVTYPRLDTNIASLEGAQVLALDGTGQLDVGFGTRGHLDAPSGIFSTLIVGQDNSVAFTHFGVQVFAADGSQRPSFLSDMYADLDVQADGDYVLFGYDRSLAIPTKWTLRRFDSKGSLDTSFGTGGVVTRDTGGGFPVFSDVLVLPDGKILAGGNTRSGGSTYVIVFRFNRDGSADASFGENGRVTLRYAGGGGGRMVLDPALNKIYVLGAESVVARLEYDGAVDASYPGVSLPAGVSLRQFALDAQGRIVLFGTASPSPDRSEGYVARFLPTGLPDTGFGTLGSVFVHVGPASQLSVTRDGALQPDGKLLVLLMTAPASDAPSTLLSRVTDVAVARLNADGTPDLQFGVGPDADVYPGPFAFAADTAPFGTTFVVSNIVTISDINSPTSVALASGSGEFSIGCTGTFTGSRALISPGQLLCLRHSAAAQAGGTTSMTIDVGGRQATYSTTASNVSADFTPDAFAFTPKTAVQLDVTVVSDPVTITGLTGAGRVTVSGGQYSVGCDPQQFTDRDGTIVNGQTVCVRHTSAMEQSISTTTLLTISGVTAAFTSTTEDSNPDPFSFSPRTGVAVSSVVTSGAVVISGITTRAPVNVSGGEYSVPCGTPFTSEPGEIENGQTVCVRYISADTPLTSKSMTLWIGDVSGDFATTTTEARKGGGGAVGWLDLLALTAFLCVTLNAPRRRPGTCAVRPAERTCPGK